MARFSGPAATQEMVFEAHDRVFAFFKGACTQNTRPASVRFMRRLAKKRAAMENSQISLSN
jgi:hypothetical protein